MMRRSGSTYMNRTMLSKYAFLTAVCSYHIASDSKNSLFEYVNFNTQQLSGVCCDICSNPKIMHNLNTLDHYKVENEYFKLLTPKPEVDWYNILSDRLGSIKYLIDDSLNLLFESNPLIFEYDQTDLINITKRYHSVNRNIQCMAWLEKTYAKFYASLLGECDEFIISDCWYYEDFYPAILKNEPNKLIRNYPSLFASDYPYIDLINLYPEHPLYNKPIVNKYPIKSRMNDRKEYLNKFFNVRL